jgi:hypothetical protein
MTSLIRKLFGREKLSETDRDLKQLIHDIRRDPKDFPISDLRPILVPSEVLATDEWIGPSHTSPSCHSP